MIYLRNKFHTPSFNGSLVIVIKPKAVKKTPPSPFCYRFNKNSILFPLPITTHHFRILEFVALANYRVTSTRANRNVLLPSSRGLQRINKCHNEMSSNIPEYVLRVQLKRDSTRWRTGGEMKGKLAIGVGSQYPSHYFGTWCIQHYYRWCAHLGCQ